MTREISKGRTFEFLYYAICMKQLLIQQDMLFHRDTTPVQQWQTSIQLTLLDVIQYTKGHSLSCPDPNSFLSQQPITDAPFHSLSVYHLQYDFFPACSTSSLEINCRPLEFHQVFSCYSLHDEDLTSQPYDSACSRGKKKNNNKVTFMPLPGSLPVAGVQAWDVRRSLLWAMAAMGRKGAYRKSTEI